MCVQNVGKTCEYDLSFTALCRSNFTPIRRDFEDSSSVIFTIAIFAKLRKTCVEFLFSTCITSPY